MIKNIKKVEYKDINDKNIKKVEYKDINDKKYLKK